MEDGASEGEGKVSFTFIFHPLVLTSSTMPPSWYQHQLIAPISRRNQAYLISVDLDLDRQGEKQIGRVLLLTNSKLFYHRLIKSIDRSIATLQRQRVM
jgi:hypothetical protein